MLLCEAAAEDSPLLPRPTTGLPGTVLLADAVPVPHGLAVHRGGGTWELLVAEGLDVHTAGDRDARRNRHVVAVQRVRVEPLEADRSEVTLVHARVCRDDRVVHGVLTTGVGRSRGGRGDGDAGREACSHRQGEETSLDAATEVSSRLGVLHFTLRSVLETNR